MRLNWAQNVYTQKVNDFGTAITVAKYPVSGSFIDVTNFTHFAFLIFAGTLDSALTCQVEEADAADGTPQDITGAVKIIGATDDNKWSSIEVAVEEMDLEDDMRYVTLDITGAAGSNDYLCIVFVGWNIRHRPVTQPTNYLTAVRIPTGS